MGGNEWRQEEGACKRTLSATAAAASAAHTAAAIVPGHAQRIQQRKHSALSSPLHACCPLLLLLARAALCSLQPAAQTGNRKDDSAPVALTGASCAAKKSSPQRLTLGWGEKGERVRRQEERRERSARQCFLC